MGIVTVSVAVARRPRAFVGATGPEAADFLNRMVSNDVLSIETGESCDALLLTAKGRVIATLRVVRRDADDYLLLTEPELGHAVLDHLRRARFAAKVELALEPLESFLLLGPEASAPAGLLAIPTRDYALPGFEVIGTPDGGAPALSADELELLRIEAGTPRFGNEIDERIVPAEAGLEEQAISFTKGCYPGQEPVARLHFRGHTNRRLRVLRIECGNLPEPETEILCDGRAVGRITSAALAGGDVRALGYVRTEVPDDAELRVDGAAARMMPPRRP